MLQNLKRQFGKDEDQGFTLIELMVVVLIIAILLAIAIPTFLGARGTANARAAESTVRNAVTAQSSYFTNTQAFGLTTIVPPATTTIQSTEPSLSWKDASALTALPVKGANVDQIVTGGTTPTVTIWALGADGKCYYALDSNGTVTKAKTASSATACTAPVAADYVTGW